eukprot:scaffold94979_cov17-Prasinocladus_malaysianus.AAC.1
MTSAADCVPKTEASLMQSGVRRPPLSEDMKMRQVIATHEVGKGIVAKALRKRHSKIEEVERVSI